MFLLSYDFNFEFNCLVDFKDRRETVVAGFAIFAFLGFLANKKNGRNGIGSFGFGFGLASFGRKKLVEV